MPPITEVRRCAEVVEIWKGQESTIMVGFNQCKVGYFCDVPQWPFGSLANCFQVAQIE